MFDPCDNDCHVEQKTELDTQLDHISAKLFTICSISTIHIASLIL